MACIISPVTTVLFLSSFLYLQVFAKYYDVVPYIINGNFTRYDEFPFMAALGWKNNATDQFDYLGGGMLVSPNFVLTAAHCVFLNGKLPSVVSVGGNLLDTPQNNEIHDVKDFFLYPEYDNNQAYNDIALIQLVKSSGKPPVCLWTRPTLYTKNVTAIGYGVTQFAGSRSVALQKVKLIVFPEKICKPYFKRQRKFRSGIWDSHLCAGDSDGKKDTCQGDSGGPLLVESGYQTYAAGITSTGQACSGFPPAVYTRISSFIEWIEETVSEHGSKIRQDCEEDVSKEEFN